MPREIANPPDPNPKKPKFAPPPGACDTHFHLFGPREKYPFAENATYEAPDATPEMHGRLMAILGLSRGVVVSGGAYVRDYRRMADALAEYPDRYRGIALMPEDASDAEFARLTKLGVRGLRFMSAKRTKVLPTLHEGIARRAHEHGWHVQFYPAPGDIVDYADRLLALPNDIVLDHFAGVPAEGGVDQPAFRAVLRMLDTGRVWVKLSGPMRCTRQPPPYSSITPLARALVAHAPERMVWGSDWPHVNMNDLVMPNDGDLIDLLLDWVPDEATRNRILVDNACALYGFSKP